MEGAVIWGIILGVFAGLLKVFTDRALARPQKVEQMMEDSVASISRHRVTPEDVRALVHSQKQTGQVGGNDMFYPNDLTIRPRYDLTPYEYDSYRVTRELPSPLAIIAERHPEMAIELARTNGLIKARCAAIIGANARVSEGIMIAGAAVLEEVRQNGLGERGILIEIEKSVTIPGTSYQGWFRTYGPEESRAGYRLVIKRL